MYKRYFKRLLDIIISVLLLCIFFPLIIIMAVVCIIKYKKVLLTQNVDGLFQKSFLMYKFYTGNKNNKLVKIIRCLGIDELPQLFNVLKGNMSIVGPRPFITGEKLLINPDKVIFTTKPGIISLASANGREKMSLKKRLKYDYLYATNINFRLDIYIVIKTLSVIIKQFFRGELWKMF